MDPEPNPSEAGPPAARGLAILLGLHPFAAILVMLTDTLLFGGEVLSGGLLILFSFLASIVLGWIVYRIQRHSFGEDHNAAFTKAIAIGLVTAIPTPLSPIVAIPTGLIGTVGMVLRRKA